MEPETKKTWWHNDVNMTWQNVMANIPAIFLDESTKQFIKSKWCQKKVYNKHIIIKVTWSGVQYHVSWMRPYHWITLYASRLRWSDGMTSYTSCVSGDPMVWPHTLDMIEYARSSYFYNNVYIPQASIKKLVSIFVFFWVCYWKFCKKVCMVQLFLHANFCWSGKVNVWHFLRKT